jgi:hypothetical protein
MLAPEQLADEQTFCDEILEIDEMLEISQLAQAVCVLVMVGGRL